MRLKIIDNQPGVSLKVVGRPGVGTILTPIIFLFVLVATLWSGERDTFSLVALIVVCGLLFFLVYLSFIKLEITNQQKIIFKTGLKAENLSWTGLKKFKTSFKKRTAKGSTIYAVNILALFPDREINIFHAVLGGWGDQDEKLWQEIKTVLSSFGLEVENII